YRCGVAGEIGAAVEGARDREVPSQSDRHPAHLVVLIAADRQGPADGSACIEREHEAIDGAPVRHQRRAGGRQRGGLAEEASCCVHIAGGVDRDGIDLITGGPTEAAYPDEVATGGILRHETVEVAEAVEDLEAGPRIEIGRTAETASHVEIA